MADAVDQELREELAPEFQVIRRLGKGSVADVFLAREAELKRLVALKVLRRSIAEDETARRRFLREARSAARISHPNVVSVYRVGTLSGDGRPFLVMEYIDGRDLKSLVAAEGPRSIAEGRRMLADLARGLDAAHTQGIVHRDVRPANVMRTKDGRRTVLTDFGIAAVLESDGEAVTQLTLAGQRLGEVRYSSPEQLRGEKVTEAADVYSLAVTAYEILTGRGPHEGERAAQLIRGHLEGDPVPLSRLRPDADPALERLLVRCLAKTPDHRPSVRQIVSVLEGDPDAAGAAGTGLPPDTMLGTVATFLGELKRRHVYKVGTAYLIFAAGVVGFGEALFGDRLLSVVAAVVLGAFPVVLVLAWMYDITSGGIQRTRGRAVSVKIRVLQVGGLLVSLALAGLIGWVILSL